MKDLLSPKYCNFQNLGFKTKPLLLPIDFLRHGLYHRLRLQVLYFYLVPQVAQASVKNKFYLLENLISFALNPN